jgi:hypothetical protein
MRSMGGMPRVCGAECDVRAGQHVSEVVVGVRAGQAIHVDDADTWRAVRRGLEADGRGPVGRVLDLEFGRGQPTVPGKNRSGQEFPVTVIKLWNGMFTGAPSACRSGDRLDLVAAAAHHDQLARLGKRRRLAPGAVAWACAVRMGDEGEAGACSC